MKLTPIIILLLIISLLIFLLVSKITFDPQEFIKNPINSTDPSSTTSGRIKENLQLENQKSTSSQFSPPGFRGPTGKPQIIGPFGPPPNY